MINLIIFFLTCCILILLILIVTYFINIPTNDYEKHSAYECGFEPFGDARSFFDIHFYTIGLLFIIFDLEIVFLIPVVVDIANISFIGYVNLIIFMFIILIGFYYEWCIGLLNWVPEKMTFNKSNNYFNFFSNNSFFFVNLELINYIDIAFLILLLLILFSLFFNQLSNLIYRVINLAFLSILIIAMWSFFTDIIFIYIVYILAFVGAVVMFFLSVILMLPSSVTFTNSLKNYNIIILSIVLKFENVNNFSITILDILYFIILYLFFKFIIDVIKEDYFYIINFFKNNSIKEISFKKAMHICKEVLLNFGIGAGIADLRDLTATKSRIRYLPKRLRAIMHIHNILYFIYLNIELKINGKNMNYKNIFNIFREKYPILSHSILVRYVVPLPYIPNLFQYSWLNKINLYYNIRQKNRYLFSKNMWLNKFINYIILTLSICEFIIINIFLQIYYYLKTNFIILIKNLSIIISIIFLIIPYFIRSNIKINDYFIHENLENLNSLLAIKHILYEENNLFLLLSIIGLLIALIGSAVFTRINKKK
jgi:NADH-quinone oxidoreductase subunit A